MKTVQIGNDDEFDLFTAVNTGKCVHVYKNVSLECIVRAPEHVKDLSLTEAKSSPGSHGDSNPGWQLYVLSNSGIIYRVSRNQALIERHQNAEGVSGSKSDNHEIFNDLLESGLVSDPFDLQLASEEVYNLNHSHVILKVKEETVSISVACGFVAVVSENVRFFMIDLYLEEFHKNLPDSIKPVSTFYSQKTRRKNFNEKLKYSAFFVVSDLHSIQSDNCSASLNLPKSFYQALFGSESALINSPVLLICPPDGSVFYAPIKSMHISSQYPDQNLRNLKILCHTNYPVLRIKATNLKLKQKDKNIVSQALQISSSSEEDFSWQPSLILCTHDGFSLAVTANGKNQIVFLTFSVPGPVEDFDVYGSQVYHSTGSDVSETEVEVCYEDTLLTLNVSRSRSLSYQGVQKLICLPKHGEIHSTKCDLLVKIPDSRLKVIKPYSKPRFTSSKVSSNVAGQRIGDLLHCMDSCSSRLDNVKLLQGKQTSFLTQLTIASNLIASFSQNEDLKNKFTFKFEVQKICQDIRLSFESDWLLVCHVTNQSQVTLSSDWMLMVSVRQKTAAGYDKDQVTYTFSLSDGLKSKSTVRFELSPLKHNPSLLTPLEVETTLLLHLPDFTSCCFLDQLQRETKPCDIRILPILLNISSIDILYSLVSADVIRLDSTDIGHDRNLDDIITLLAKTKPISECLNTEAGSAGKFPSNSGEMKVFLPAAVRTTSAVSKYGKGNVAVLKYILEHSPRPVDLTTSHITMLTLVGEKLHLRVDDVTSDKNGEGVEKDLVIVIHANHRCTAVAVHQAVVSKFKELNTVVGLNDITLTRMSSELTKLEGYLKEIRTLQDESEGQAHNFESGKKLLKLHENVRNLVSLYKC